MPHIGCCLFCANGYLAMSRRKDRHERIGEGSIGLEATARIINHPQLRHLPLYLETPNEIDGYAKEIALLQSLVRQPRRAAAFPKGEGLSAKERISGRI